MKSKDPVTSIMDSFRRIVRTLRMTSRASENEMGLRAAPAFVLQRLHEFEPLSLNELADKTYSHQSTVSIVINGLVKKGLVQKSPSKNDRRQLVLQTTTKGKTLLKKRKPTVQERFAGALAAMSTKERKDLAQLLEIFIDEAGLSNEVPHFFFEKERR